MGITLSPAKITQGDGVSILNPYSATISIAKMAHSSSSKMISIDVVYSASATLTSDIYVAGNITINSTVVITTNGYNLYCTGTFTNNGTINTGGGNASGGNGGTAPNGLYIQANSIIAGTISANGIGGLGSYGIGGSGGSAIFLAYNKNSTPPTTTSITVSGGAGSTNAGNTNTGMAGGATLVPGGPAGTSSSEDGQNGSTPTLPTFTNAMIQTMYTNGFSNYLVGGGGGGYNSAGGPAGTHPLSYGGSGGGSSYGYSTTNTGGNGGAGNIILYAYSIMPIEVGAISITPTTTGNVRLKINGVKNGSTLGSEISTITLTNQTTNNAFSIDIMDGTGINGEIGVETGLMLNTPYYYVITSANDTTGIFANISIDEVR